MQETCGDSPANALPSLLFDAGPQPMWVFDGETFAFLAVNDAAISQYGFGRDEFLSMTVCDLGPPDDVPALNLEGGRGVEVRHRCRDGTLLWAEVASQPIYHEGRAARLVVATDVTRLKETEKALRESEERLRAVVGGAPLILFALDGDGVFTFSDGRGLETIGLRPGEVVGQSFLARYEPWPDVAAAARRSLGGECVQATLAAWGRTFEVRFTPARGDGGRPAGGGGAGAPG